MLGKWAVEMDMFLRTARKCLQSILFLFDYLELQYLRSIGIIFPDGDVKSNFDFITESNSIFFKGSSLKSHYCLALNFITFLWP